MVHSFSFPKKIHKVNFFGKRTGFFCPADGDITRQTRDRLSHGSIGRFAVFAHVVFFVVQTPTA